MYWVSVRRIKLDPSSKSSPFPWQQIWLDAALAQTSPEAPLHTPSGQRADHQVSPNPRHGRGLSLAIGDNSGVLLAKVRPLIGGRGASYGPAASWTTTSAGWTSEALQLEHLGGSTDGGSECPGSACLWVPGTM